MDFGSQYRAANVSLPEPIDSPEKAHEKTHANGVNMTQKQGEIKEHDKETRDNSDYD